MKLLLEVSDISIDVMERHYSERDRANYSTYRKITRRGRYSDFYEVLQKAFKYNGKRAYFDFSRDDYVWKCTAITNTHLYNKLTRKITDELYSKIDKEHPDFDKIEDIKLIDEGG